MLCLDVVHNHTFHTYCRPATIINHLVCKHNTHTPPHTHHHTHSTTYHPPQVRMTNDQEYVFRSIPKDEWQNLYNWVSAKQLPLENIAEVQKGPHGQAKAAKLDLEPDIDAGMAHMQAKGEVYSDEDDEDFDAGTGSEKDSDEDSDEDAAGLDERKDRGKPHTAAGGAHTASPTQGGGASKAPLAAPKRPAGDGAPAKAAKKQKGGGGADGEGGEGVGGKKQRKKKDPNAPKNASGPYMFYSQAHREQVKAENPGMTFGELGKVKLSLGGVYLMSVYLVWYCLCGGITSDYDTTYTYILSLPVQLVQSITQYVLYLGWSLNI